MKTNFDIIKAFTPEEMKAFIYMITDDGHNFFTESLCKTCPYFNTSDCEKQIEEKLCPGTQDDVGNWLKSSSW